ncbi:MAG: hypothetical protein UZ22_OP11002001102 [Microgenomates bacterium OLB23]|nr:MAG: hypothetical protein UZ22_OP11002001102 [Microgenomates bacterium OLB23]
MPSIQQKIRTATQERFEDFKDSTVEKARENFSRLPDYLLEQITGSQHSKEEKKPEQKNYTSFSEEIRAQLGIAFEAQDKPKLEQTRDELAALKRQMDYMRGEEEQARAYLKNKDEERKQRLEAEDEQAAALELKQQQAAASGAEPATKAKRGQEKRKMPDKTMENKASFGKQ